MKILRPVDVNNRLPEIDRFVLTIDEAGNQIIYKRTEYGWNMRDGIAANSPNNNLKITYWYEEIEIESLFPSDEKSYNVASAASGDRINGTMLHQEGQSFLKNHILRKLKE